MGYKLAEDGSYVGFTTDTKPTDVAHHLKIGGNLWEIDPTTKKAREYIWDGDWYPKNIDTSLLGSNLGVDASGNLLPQANSYRGLSTSVKPTTNIPLYSTYLEMNTSNIYYWNGTSWVVM